MVLIGRLAARFMPLVSRGLGLELMVSVSCRSIIYTQLLLDSSGQHKTCVVGLISNSDLQQPDSGLSSWIIDCCNATKLPSIPRNPFFLLYDLVLSFQMHLSDGCQHLVHTESGRRLSGPEFPAQRVLQP